MVAIYVRTITKINKCTPQKCEPEKKMAARKSAWGNIFVYERLIIVESTFLIRYSGVAIANKRTC